MKNGGIPRKNKLSKPTQEKNRKSEQAYIGVKNLNQ